MENGTLSAAGFYAEPPLSPVSATAHILSVAPPPTNHVALANHYVWKGKLTLPKIKIPTGRL